jgi:hypothetical protein
MVTRIIRNEDLNVSMVPYNSYKLNAHAYNIINKVLNIKDKNFGGCTVACLDPTMLALSQHDACGPLNAH